MFTNAEAALTKLAMFLALGLVVTNAACTQSGSAPSPASSASANSTGTGAQTDSSTSSDPSVDGSTSTPTTTTGATGSGTSGLYISSDPNCQSSTACAPATPALLVETLQKGALTGVSNETVNWEFIGYDTSSSTRQIAVLIGAIPSDATSDPTLSLGTVTSNVVVTWTPPQPISGSFTIILRDWDRCLVTEADNSVCIQPEYNSQYDTKQPPQPYVISPQPGTAIQCPQTNFLSGLAGFTTPPGC